MPVLLGESFIEQLGGQSSVKGKFSGIVSLNVSDNPIESVAAMVDEIVLLMPGVRDLQMSLYREADVDLIIQRLPRLQMLNNIAVEADDVARVSQSPPSEFEAGVAASAKVAGRPMSCEQSMDISERRLMSEIDGEGISSPSQKHH